MKATRRIALLVSFITAPLFPQVTPADYQRSEGLRDAWQYLTKNVADLPRWIGDSDEFVYRKTVPGGFSFILMDARSQRKTLAFDHERLAAALSRATGTTYTALRLPFTDVDFTPDKSAISFRIGEEARFTCRPSDYICDAGGRGGRGGRGGTQPRG